MYRKFRKVNYPSQGKGQQTTQRCLPFGIVGIIFAAQAMGAQSRGDYYETQEKVAKAKTWTTVSFGLGLLVIVCSIAANINQLS